MQEGLQTFHIYVLSMYGSHRRCEQGRLRVPRAGGKVSSEGTSLYSICISLHRSSFWSSNSFPEKQCLVYSSPSATLEV